MADMLKGSDRRVSPLCTNADTRNLRPMTSLTSEPLTASATVTPLRDEQKDKRERIIQRAVMMFNEFGYDRVRVSDITDSLNIGKGTFYLYFKNKRDLLLTCFDHVAEQILVLESLPTIRKGDFFTRIGPRTETVHAYDWWPGLINLLRAAELSPDSEIKAKARRAYETITGPLKRDLQEAIETGRAREVDGELAAYGFVGLAENLWFRSRLDSRYTPDQITRFMIDVVTHWLAAECVMVRPEPELAPGAAARLTTRDGARFDLTGVQWNGTSRLNGLLGLAQIEVDLTNVSSLAVAGLNEQWVADLVTTDGTQVRLRVDGAVVVSGEYPLGTVRIAVRDLMGLVRA